MGNSIADSIREQVEAKGEALWQLDDFAHLSPSAAAKALSRLSQDGTLERIAKGIYYRPGTSTFGKTKPSPKRLRELAAKQHRLFPAGLAAANLLGFSTQTPNRIELSTTATSVHRRLLGAETVVHTRRPAAWNRLSDEEAAILEMLRSGGTLSELTKTDSTHKLLELLAVKRRFENLLSVADTEPARVQAMLGAAGQELGKPQAKLLQLREKLNPLSRFDFGHFASLRFAKLWQAKNSDRNEALPAS